MKYSKALDQTIYIVSQLADLDRYCSHLLRRHLFSQVAAHVDCHKVQTTGVYFGNKVRYTEMYTWSESIFNLMCQNMTLHDNCLNIVLSFNLLSCYILVRAGLGGSLDAPSDWRPGGRGFNPRRGRQHSFVEIDHEIFSTVILSLPLIQEGQLSVSGERMCTILVNRLED